MAGKSVQALWQDYHFLTKEMHKFLIKQDMILFYDLMNQREGLQSLIEQAPDNGFRQSAEGRCLLKEIEEVNQAVLQAMRIRMGNSRRQHQVSKAYSAVNTAAVSRMNRK
ncbi:hypothetical protein Desor_4897 [Desulfosporosinus orientis DSM 765]|uniref:FlgN protein n=1 Tax=Desulfosporosinus orientis (strain ATCC 19365 / DSM 765 / NCIMB 8382 / VKM B-1628 / Singapore I) TaxID=768706 RepID=G7WI01_DESOD|nr:hypothetical protein [Desulfosporosinus orientis]AET70298.1 hypothetical protein Desor_4897 [Desulfosporosinus orientis DSM 765]